MLVQVNREELNEDLKAGDIVELSSGAYLVARAYTDIGKYNLVQLEFGTTYYMNDKSLPELNKLLLEAKAKVYSSQNYIFELKRRNH